MKQIILEMKNIDDNFAFLEVKELDSNFQLIKFQQIFKFPVSTTLKQRLIKMMVKERINKAMREAKPGIKCWWDK